MALSVEVINYVQGDLLRGSVSLIVTDDCTGIQSPYQIPSLSEIQVRFPGTVSTVTIDSNTPVPSEFGGGFEVTVTSYSGGAFDYVLVPSKGAGVKISTVNAKGVASPQAIDIVNLDNLGAQLQTFKILPPSGIAVTTVSNA